MISATLNEATPLTVLAADGRSDLYARVQLYAANGALVQTLPLTHVANGLYSALWTPQVEGFFTAITQLYYDSSYTIAANYERAGDLIEVSTTKTNILRLMGLHHDNSVLDQQIYDGNGNMIQARLRCYDTREHALAATSVGVRFVYTIAATYANGNMTKYMVTREQ